MLAQSIRENENIHGLKINDTELKLSMYADDLTAFIKDERSASQLFSLLPYYMKFWRHVNLAILKNPDLATP